MIYISLLDTYHDKTEKLLKFLRCRSSWKSYLNNWPCKTPGFPGQTTYKDLKLRTYGLTKTNFYSWLAYSPQLNTLKIYWSSNKVTSWRLWFQSNVQARKSFSCFSRLGLVLLVGGKENVNSAELLLKKVFPFTNPPNQPVRLTKNSERVSGFE